MIKIEKEFDACVNEIGGHKVSTIVGQNPKFLNADYLFSQYKVIAELKCLEEDLIKSKNIRRKATDIYERYVARGKAPRLQPGITKITCDGLPDEFKHEIIELYRGSVHTAIKKANKQIKDTAANLKLDKHHGLLILANDNHTALNPRIAMWILSNTFSRYRFGSINSVLYFTANLKAEHPKIQREVCVWIPSHREPTNKCPSQLLERLNTSWLKRVSLLTNEPVFKYQAEAMEALDDISNT